MEKTGKFDCLGIGNAIVDVLVEVDDAFLQQHNLNKSTMTLMDETRAMELYEAMPSEHRQVSGGSSANTIAGIASFGGKPAFIGKVKNDTFGDFFRMDLRKLGVEYRTVHSTGGAKTAVCLVFITPDGERTMSTYLGATRGITVEDIDESLIAASKVVYFEGYLWDGDDAVKAIRHAINLTHKHGKKVAFSLSDLFCVERHREEFRSLLHNQVDILFGNEHEFKALFEVETFEEAAAQVQGKVKLAAITRSAQGSVIIDGNNRHVIPATPIKKLIDSTGAGDMYAAGFLYGYTHDLSLQECGALASQAASEVIQHIGARPKEPYSRFLQRAA